jgi:hypothetical protein
MTDTNGDSNRWQKNFGLLLLMAAVGVSALASRVYETRAATENVQESLRHLQRSDQRPTRTDRALSLNIAARGNTRSTKRGDCPPSC